jgi:hypothetical protein
MSSVDKVYIIENILDKKDLEKIIFYLKNTPVAFDETGYSPYGVYAGGDSPVLAKLLEPSYSKIKNIIESSFNCTVYDEGVTSVVELKTGDSMPVHLDHGSAQNKTVGLKTGAGHPSRDISSVLYYNNNYEGGEIYFPNQDLLIKPEPGMFICFPAKDEFPHQVREIKSGYRWCSTNFWCIKKD